MLTYSLENRGKMPLYEYLYHMIRKDILEGTLKSGEKLPSKRSLASHLNISVITVENAYAQLAEEGYLYTKEKRGYFVSEITPMIAPKGTKRALVAFDQEPPSSESYLADFRTNAIADKLFPFSTWSKIMREILSERQSSLLQKAPGNGVYELRKAIADFLLRFRGMSVSPEQIIIGAGTEYLYGLLISLFGTGHTYAVEDPGYPSISRIYQSHSVPCIPIPMDSKGLSVTELAKSDATIVHLSPSHHFPTGIIMPISRRQELLSWCNEKKNRYIIEDDYDSEFRFSGKPIPTLQSIDGNERVIYMNTFSKTLTHSIRISYMVLPMVLMERYQKNLGFYSCTVSNFEQYALSRFIEKGYFEQHINRMRNAYKNLRNELLTEIRTHFNPAQIKIQEENAGLHFLLNIHTSLSDKELEQRAGDAGIRITCLSHYFHDPARCKEHILVMNYSGIESASVPEGIRRLVEAIESR